MTHQVDITKHLQSHRSIRKFKQQPIPADVKEDILSSAQMASTSSHVQAYSIIGVTDQEKKRQIAEWAGQQSYVEQCGHFLVFCADLNRLEHVLSKQGVETDSFNHTEPFLVASVDAALAAQNAAIAAEAHGLGTVYIGGIRNEIQKVSDLLNLPDLVYPVFGMCMGYPDQDPAQKPRLPQEAIYFENEYPTYEHIESHVEEFDNVMKHYYEERTQGKRTDTWSDMMVKTLGEPRRTHMKSFLQSKGFMLK